MKRISEHEYMFNAQFQLDDFTKTMNVPRPDSAYHTIGGWVIENFGYIPSISDSFIYNNLKVTIDEVENRRVRKINVEILSDNTGVDREGPDK